MADLPIRNTRFIRQMPGAVAAPTGTGYRGGFASNAPQIQPLDGRVFERQARGGVAIGQAIESGGKDVGVLVDESNRARNDMALRGLDDKIKLAELELKQAWETEPDPSKWASITEKHLSGFRNGVDLSGMSPAAREMASARLDAWGTMTAKTAEVKGNLALIDRRNDDSKERYETAVILKDKQGAAAYRQALVNDGVITQAAADSMAARDDARIDQELEQDQRKVIAAGKSAAFDRVAGLIMSDPHRAQEIADAGKLKAEFPELDETDLLNVTGDIRRAVAVKESEAVETAADLISDPKTTAADLEVLAEGGKLRPAIRAKLMEAHRKAAEDRAQAAPLDKGELAKLAADIDSYGEAEQQADKEKGGEKYGELLTRLARVSSQGGAEGRDAWGVLHSRLYQRHYLHERRPAGADKEALQMASKFMGALGDAGAFGPATTRQKVKAMEKDQYGNDVEKEKWIDAPNHDTAIRRVKHEAQIMRELEDALKKQPELADPFEQEKWLRKRLSAVQGAGTLKMSMPAVAAPDAGPSAEFFTPPADLQPFADGNILLR